MSTFKLKQTESGKVLVLDLDETLIHCNGQNFENATEYPKLCIGDTCVDLFICARPGLEEFVAKMSKIYTLVLFTTGTKEYAHLMLRLMKIEGYFSHVLHRKHCHLNSESKYEKSLAILGIKARNIILVDDSAVHEKYQPNNILLIKPFKGEKDDAELPKVAEFLEGLAQEDDVRPVGMKYRNFEENLESTNLVTLEPDFDDVSESSEDTKTPEGSIIARLPSLIRNPSKWVIGDIGKVAVGESFSELATERMPLITERIPSAEKMPVMAPKLKVSA